ncbi:MAG: protein translocase subunit SecD [Firmicutes bacterium]|nr:protein translocase subunit SecD [Bacillota bacterium]
MKKAIAALTAVLIILACIFSLTGLGPIAPVQESLKLGLDFQGGVYVVMEAQTKATGEELADLMERTQSIIENRVNQMGLSEPVVTVEGENRIRVELPGAENAEDAIKTIGKTAQLLFLLGNGSVVLDGSMVKDAYLTQGQTGLPAVGLEFNSDGAKAFAEATKQASSGKIFNINTGVTDRAIYISLDDKIISNPQANTPITDGKAVIEGNFTTEEAIELVQLIRGGALPVNLVEVETSVIGPNLGIDALQSSVIAGAVVIGLVLIVMLVFYYGMGIVANVALLLYVVATFWVLALFAAVLNLPGIAGIILGVGMAVDANVIIYARIREEFANGKTLRVAVDGGFKRAFSTVVDSQVTTLIAGLVLYQFGTGPVKGFALTLMISIFISVLTAVVVSQFLLKSMVSGKISPKFFGAQHWMQKITPKLTYIKHRNKLYIFSAAIIVLGLAVGLIRGFNYGIDFTGGTRLHIDMGEVVAVDDIRDIMKENGLEGSVVHSGEGNKEIVIKTTSALDNELRQEVLKDFNAKFGTTEDDVLAIEHFSASVGKMLTNNAVKAVLLASACMLVYIIIRFEWRFGIGAIVALAHDVLMVVAIYGLFNIPINNPFIAGILTVVGYSINDTIVVFDRIRENGRLMKKTRLEELIDTSINQTLVRSLMTSVTTLVAILPLMFMGGKTIREFCVPLIVGILAGALSSVTIASPVYYELAKRGKKSKYVAKTAKKSKKNVLRAAAEQEEAEK